MHYFIYKGNKLFCEGVAVEELAKKYGTPLYVYSQYTFAEHFKKLDAAFKNIPHLVCFAVKANANMAILSSLNKLGSGFDIVSGGELYKAIKIGADPQKIVFAGVGKTSSEIAYALKVNVLMFNVESVAEAYAIQEVARSLKKKAKIAIRVNPDVTVDTHAYITTGKKGTKFGVQLNAVKGLIKNLLNFGNIEIVGLHFHIGSQITTTRPYIEAAKKAVRLVRDVRDMGVPISFLNLGGGLGITYNKENPSTADKFAQAILPYLKGLNVKLLLEPGRFIVGSAGILVTKVLYLKESANKNFVIVDGGMNDLIRPSLYEAYHYIQPLRKVKVSHQIVDVVGPVCESGDFFAKDRSLPLVKSGDYLAVMSAGAYGYVMASNYNARGKPAEILVCGTQSYLVKKRETIQDLIRGERVPVEQ